MIVTYTNCRGCGRKGSYVEDDRGQGVLKDRTFWCRCRGKKVEGGAPTERKSIAKVEKAARPREAKMQQSGAWLGEPEGIARKKESSTPTERKSTAREGGS